MKTLLIIVLVIACAANSGCRQSPRYNSQTVNPLLGDISFISQYGRSPGPETDERLRIAAHLEYVEHLLRNRDVAHLPPMLRERRMQLLALLGAYRRAGVFPENNAHSGKRVPCFIDQSGRICAVGYLVEHTAGRQAAEDINRKYQYAPLLAMNDGSVSSWIQQSGLTMEEAAMIQPSYGYTPPPGNNYIKPAYGAASAVMSGATLSLSAINGIQLARQSGSKWAPALGMATGIGQILLGAANLQEEEQGLHVRGYTNESQKLLSMVNIGLGTASVIFSACNLLSNRPHSERRTTWDIRSFPAAGASTGLALSFTRKF